MAAKKTTSRRQADADRRDDLLRRVLPKRSRDSESIRPALVALWSALKKQHRREMTADELRQATTLWKLIRTV